MTPYDTLNVKLSNSQHNKLKSGIEKDTEALNDTEGAKGTKSFVKCDWWF